MNRALLMKIGWNIIASPHSLWIQVLLSKYGVDKDNLPLALPTRYGSPLWKAVGNIWNEVIQGTRWAIGNGRLAKFWKDCWLEDGRCLQSYTRSPMDENMMNECVANYVDSNGMWSWDRFSSLLPNHIILRIAGTLPPIAGGEDDYRYWGPAKSGTFSVSLLIYSSSSPCQMRIIPFGA